MITLTGAAALVGMAAAGMIVQGMMHPRSQILGRVIYRGDRTGPPRVAITFDDGPHPDFTPRILDVLAEHNVKAAFFMIGRNIEQAPDVVRRVHDESHLIANHTYEHAHFGTFRFKRYWMREIQRTDELIDNIIGRRPRLFRPPMGLKSPAMFRALQSNLNQHCMVTWSRRALDGIPTTSDKIIERIAQTAQAGDIINMHDGHERPNDRDLNATLESLGPILRAWKDRGLTAARLDELIGVEPYQPD
jgi:peptidoglycan-N-acetylglucosamine deacetylase